VFHTTHFVAEHVNSVLRKKCLPTYSTTTSGSLAVWIHRHLLAHRAKRGTCPRSASTHASHLSGWICIHDREGAWNSQTGNGYYGGLQMSYDWMGVVTNAALLSPGEQIAIADRVAREHSYAYSWMAGQWPRTYPPCASYF
jgi:hypothetical protein